MKFIRTQKNAGNQIVDEIRAIAKAGLCEITKDDSISFKAKACKRIAFSVQYEAFIFQAKEICLCTEDYKAEELNYNYMFLDNNSMDLRHVDFSNNKHISIEMMSI